MCTPGHTIYTHVTTICAAQVAHKLSGGMVYVCARVYAWADYICTYHACDAHNCMHDLHTYSHLWLLHRSICSLTRTHNAYMHACTCNHHTCEICNCSYVLHTYSHIWLPRQINMCSYAHKHHTHITHTHMPRPNCAFIRFVQLNTHMCASQYEYAHTLLYYMWSAVYIRSCRKKNGLGGPRKPLYKRNWFLFFFARDVQKKICMHACSTLTHLCIHVCWKGTARERIIFTTHRFKTMTIIDDIWKWIRNKK
jgi:hypothetical protein